MMHIPVFTKEVIEFLNVKSDGTYIDVTLGGGGWSEAILKASKPLGRLFGFDRDEFAIQESVERLGDFSKRFFAYKADFSEVSAKLESLEVDAVDGVVADLGVSSFQIETGERGFSFSRDAKLDMRMDRSRGMNAYEIVNRTREKELANLIFEYGEERHSRRIAAAIVRERRGEKIKTTEQLANIVCRAMPGASRRGKIHPATRTFQALRIVVNDELGEIKKLLETMPFFMRSGARFVVVSYHSLEDRIVKNSFRELSRTKKFRLITKKPIRPDEAEVLRNRRARSARLRVMERI